jgi:capsular polysaccharide biosynthesis protein
MNELISVGICLAALVGGLLAFAPRVSESLVRSSARRLPYTLSARMREEWLAELDALPGRPSQLAFAIALTLTRRHSFAIEEDSLFAAPSRWSVTAATIGGRLSVVVFTTAVAAAFAYASSFLIPPLYQSHAGVLVVPPRVPARFVEPAVRITIDQRVREFSQLVLSRQRLEDIILQLDLYRSDRGLPTSTRYTVTNGRDVPAPNGPRIGDAAIERMRQDIRVDVHADSQSFELAYVSPDPHVALKVTERLTMLFLETYLRDREDINDSATAFLDAQIEDVRSRLLKRTGITSPSAANPSEADVRAVEHESLKTTYRGLLMKRDQAILFEAMERRQIGEQFKLLDRARLPDVPISPDRTRLTLLGAVVGFCLGVAMMLAGRYGPVKRPEKMLAQS